jgi:hypothetical protein
MKVIPFTVETLLANKLLGRGRIKVDQDYVYKMERELITACLNLPKKKREAAQAVFRTADELRRYERFRK